MNKCQKTGNDVPVESHRDEHDSRLAFPPAAMKTGPAAQYLGLSRRHVSTLAARGVPPFVKVGPRCHLLKGDLDAFLKARTITSRGGICSP